MHSIPERKPRGVLTLTDQEIIEDPDYKYELDPTCTVYHSDSEEDSDLEEEPQRKPRFLRWVDGVLVENVEIHIPTDQEIIEERLAMDPDYKYELDPNCTVYHYPDSDSDLEEEPEKN